MFLEVNKFGVITHATEMTNAVTPTSWLYNLQIHSQKEIDSNLTSRLEINFLLDRCAFTSLLIIPTYMMITQVFNDSIHDQHDTSETLTIANQSEVPRNNKSP